MGHLAGIFIRPQIQVYLSLGSSDGSPSGGSYTLTVDSDDMEIQEYSEEQDLGITFSSNLKISKHINLSIMKANRMVGISNVLFFTSPNCISYIVHQPC